MLRLKIPSLLGLMLALGFLMVSHARAAAADSRCYEMRTYYSPPGKLDDLHARFRDHTMKLFEKHGITNVGYWVPIDNTDNKLVYILSYPSRADRDKSWKAFMGDPDWQAAAKASEANGKLVTKVESTFMEPTDYSPEIKAPAAANSRVFELRTYTAEEGKLPNLNARFRDHTVALFSKHGMLNIGYWVPMKDQKGANNTLIYMLAHESAEARSQSFAAFGKDPDWTSAKTESEKNGALTIQGGVKSVLLKATDYSPMK